MQELHTESVQCLWLCAVQCNMALLAAHTSVAFTTAAVTAFATATAVAVLAACPACPTRVAPIRPRHAVHRPV